MYPKRPTTTATAPLFAQPYLQNKNQQLVKFGRRKMSRPVRRRKCYYGGSVFCRTDRRLCKVRVHECNKDENVCFKFVANDNVTEAVGCQHDKEGSCAKKSCVENSYMRARGLWCCCNTDLCNDSIDLSLKQVIEVRAVPSVTTTSNKPVITSAYIKNSTRSHGLQVAQQSAGVNAVHKTQTALKTAAYTFFPFLFICIMLLLLAWLWQRRQRKSGISVSEGNEALPMIERVPPVRQPQPLGFSGVQLLEHLATGRFGKVYLGTLGDRQVAVKVFSEHEKASWDTEKTIYELPLLDEHTGILHFLGTDVRVMTDGIQSFWLLAEYHQHGSLQEYLQRNIISWEQMLHIGSTLLDGLAFLHSTVCRGSLCKPCIAHRDFKTKNILLKDDLSACICDFGLAVTEVRGDYHQQVGTHCYMPPEVLTRAVSFNLASFLHIDVYAAALVLWELVSRCSVSMQPERSLSLVADDSRVKSEVDERVLETQPYRHPFAVECGGDSGIDADMSMLVAVVVERGLRPQIPTAWRRKYALLGAESLVRIITDSWDAHPEARLSAACMSKRWDRVSAMAVSSDSNASLHFSTKIVSDPQSCVDSATRDSTCQYAETNV